MLKGSSAASMARSSTRRTQAAALMVPTAPTAKLTVHVQSLAQQPMLASASKLSRSARRTLNVSCPAAAAATQTTADGLQVPHGGKLVNLMVPADKVAAEVASCTKSLELSDRNACDVELLSVGAFSPLEGFLNQKEYEHVVNEMRLTNGLLLGLPIVLDTSRDDIQVGDKVLLQYQGQNLGTITVDSKWVPNKVLECKKCYGTTSLEHPAVQFVSMERGKYYIGGKVKGLALPKRVFPCATPAEVRATLPKNTDVVAFQCRNPIHRAHYELFIRALDAPNVSKTGVVLVHPTCGPTQDDDIPGVVRYRTYEVLKEELDNPRVRWAYLPYSMHMAGPREAIQHMIIRKNYGCTHFIVGRDMAGSKSSLTGEDFYGAYDAQGMAGDHAAELGVQTVPSLNICYTKEKGYVTADIADAESLTRLNLSGTKFRQMLRAGDEIPEWFAFKSVVRVLREQIQTEAA